MKRMFGVYGVLFLVAGSVQALNHTDYEPFDPPPGWNQGSTNTMVDACLDDIDTATQINDYCRSNYCSQSLRNQMAGVCEVVAAADPIEPDPIDPDPETPPSGEILDHTDYPLLDPPTGWNQNSTNTMVDACLDNIDTATQIDNYCRSNYCSSQVRVQMNQICAEVALLDPLPDTGTPTDCGTFQVETWLSPLGQNREYRVYRPCSSVGSASVLIGFHYSGSDAETMVGLTEFERLADAHGFILVLPEGTPTGPWGQLWNDERGLPSVALVSRVNEVAFVAGMLSRLESHYNANVDDTYVTGYAMGGALSQSLACRNSQLAAYGYQLSGAASVSSSVASVYVNNCDSRPGMAMLQFNGTDDPIAFWCTGPESTRDPQECANTAAESGERGGSMSSVLTSRTLWEDELMCDPPLRSNSNPVSSDGTSLVAYNYQCANGSMKFYRIEGGGHTWPGTDVTLPVVADMTISRDVDASREIVRFFGLDR